MRKPRDRMMNPSPANHPRVTAVPCVQNYPIVVPIEEQKPGHSSERAIELSRDGPQSKEFGSDWIGLGYNVGRWGEISKLFYYIPASTALPPYNPTIYPPKKPWQRAIPQNRERTIRSTLVTPAHPIHPPNLFFALQKRGEGVINHIRRTDRLGKEKGKGRLTWVERCRSRMSPSSRR